MNRTRRSLVGLLVGALLSIHSAGRAVENGKSEAAIPESETSFRYGMALGMRYERAAAANGLLRFLGCSEATDQSIYLRIDLTIQCQNYDSDPVVAGKLPIDWADEMGITNEIKYMDGVIRQRSPSKDRESERRTQEGIDKYTQWRSQIMKLKNITKLR